MLKFLKLLFADESKYWPSDSEQVRKRVEELAYWHWEVIRKRQHGYDVEDWLAAEKAVMEEERCKARTFLDICWAKELFLKVFFWIYMSMWMALIPFGFYWIFCK